MSILINADNVEIFKFKSTGALPLFDEVTSFINAEFAYRGVRYEVVDLYSDEDSFYARLEKL